MKKIALLVIVATLAGCQVAPINLDYSLIDGKGVNYSQYESDYADCARLADQTNVGERAAGGAVFGVLLGAVVGHVLCGRSCAGAGARGGLVGGTVGATSSGVQEQQNALRACLVGRGYKVIR